MAEKPESGEELLRVYLNKSRELTEEEMGGVIEYAANTEDLLGLVTSMGFSKRDYLRLHKAILRAGESVRKPSDVLKAPEKELERLEGRDFKDFLREMWDDVMKVGKGSVMQWYKDAGELGYYREDLKKVDMAAFVKDAVEFYKEHKFTMEETVQENRSNKAMLSVLADCVNRALKRIALIRLTLDMIIQANPELEMDIMPVRALAPTLAEETVYG